MSRNRIATIALAVGALTATGVGIGIAATDTNSSSSPYAIEGKLPKTAAMSFSIGGADGVNITGHMNIDMVKNRMDGEIDIPVAIVMARLHIREVGNTIYIGAGAFSNSSQQWMSTPLGSKLDLTGLALTMAKPKVGLLPSAFGRPVITQDGDITVHTYNVSAKDLGMAGNTSAVVELRTASEGQVVGLTINATSNGQAFSIALKVDSYNTPMVITKPSAGSVKPLTASSLQEIVGSSDTLKQLLNTLMSGGASGLLSQGGLSL